MSGAGEGHYDLGDVRCPHCGSGASCAQEAVGKGPPAEGDLNICVYCCMPSRFTGELKLRAMDDAEIAALDPEHRRSLLQVQERLAASRVAP